MDKIDRNFLSLPQRNWKRICSNLKVSSILFSKFLVDAIFHKRFRNITRKINDPELAKGHAMQNNMEKRGKQVAFTHPHTFTHHHFNEPSN